MKFEPLSISRILVTGRLYKELSELLQHSDKQFRFLPENEVTKEDIDWADAYVAFRPVPVFHYGSLKWVHALGAGVDAYLSRGDWPSDVLLTRTIGNFGVKIAQYCLSYVLQDLQNHTFFQQQQAAQTWTPKTATSIADQNIVIFGTGTIGLEVARKFKLLGTKVYGVSKSGKSHPEFDQVTNVESMETVLRNADWVINTLPLTNDTAYLFNEHLFSQLKGAAFVNVGRGGSVNTNALLMAIEEGKVRKAILDVFEEEPLAPNNMLWNHPNVIITPHISAVTDLEEAANGFTQTLLAIEERQHHFPNRVVISNGY